MYRRIASLFLAATALLSGCTAENQAAFTEGWNRGIAFRNQVLLPSLGNAMVAYGNGVAQYEATHPTIYVQPSYVQQHGTMTVQPTGFGSFGQPSYQINY
jgi:hypothetical protein